jgi:tRNA A37 threonylcarbamoyltransferase TsaD
MADFEVQLHGRGIDILLKSKDVEDDLLRRAERIAAAAGPGMEASVIIGENRARASVITGTFAARLAEARHMALTRAIDAGRG